MTRALPHLLLIGLRLLHDLQRGPVSRQCAVWVDGCPSLLGLTYCPVWFTVRHYHVWIAVVSYLLFQIILYDVCLKGMCRKEYCTSVFTFVLQSRAHILLEVPEWLQLCCLFLYCWRIPSKICILSCSVILKSFLLKLLCVSALFFTTQAVDSVLNVGFFILFLFLFCCLFVSFYHVEVQCCKKKTKKPNNNQMSLKTEAKHYHILFSSFLFRFLTDLLKCNGTCSLAVNSSGKPSGSPGDCFHFHC